MPGHRSVETQRKETALINADEHSPTELDRIDRLAGLLDDRFRVPGTKWRFGLDGLIGLVPVAGDAVGAILSAYIVWRAWRMGASKRARIKMIGNLLFEAAVGSIPLLGDVFDIGWKANRRNLRLLKEDLIRARDYPPGRRT